MKYKILRSGELKGLEKKVNEHLQKGWILAGGISVCGGYAHAHFHQAITKGRVVFQKKALIGSRKRLYLKNGKK